MVGEIPAALAQQYGKGRVVYFPWDIDRIFWEILAVDHWKLLRNAVDWAANEMKAGKTAGECMTKLGASIPQ